jgi:glycerophosphoryl diester phosphodiesterase
VEGFAAQGPLLFAHRGSPCEHLENTLPSFETALSRGADVLELDVHMSADGHIVVMHDATGERVYGVNRAIRETRYAEIKRWSARGPRGESYSPAGFAEVLEAFPHAALNVDVKQERPDMVQVLLDLIMGYAAEERVLLTSFCAHTLKRIRQLGYQGPLGMSRRDAALFLLGPRLPSLLPRAGAQRLQIPTRYGRLNLATRGYIEKAHGAGLRVDYWVVNNPLEAEHLLDLGADGIVTDDPEAIAHIFARHVRTRGFRARRAADAAEAASVAVKGLPRAETMNDVHGHDSRR